MNQMNYYHLLGIEPSATAAEIKTAYRKLSMKFHPDRNNGDTFLEEMFKQINEAHEVLADPDRRKAYDASLGPEKAPQGNPERPNQHRSSAKFDDAALKREIQRFLILEETNELQKLAYHQAKYLPANAYLTPRKILMSILVMIAAYVIGKPSPNSTEVNSISTDRMTTNGVATLYYKPDFHSRAVGKVSAGTALDPVRETQYFVLVRCQDSLGHRLRGYILKDQIRSAP